MNEKIRLVVIDDHPLFRSGVVMTLQAEPDMEVVADGGSMDDAVRLTQEFRPDMVLLDIGIPGNGITAAHTISTTYPDIKIVMITGSDDEERLLMALRAGAKGYILKGVSARELTDIIRSVWGGDVYVTPTLAASLLIEMSAPAPHRTLPATNPLDELTEREHQILELVAIGASNKEIGLKLFLTEKTVKHYMTNVLQKLQVRNRVEAAVLAQRHQ